MRSAKATLLLFLFSFVLAHAAVPHRHHVEPPVKHHHQHQADHHHHHDDEKDDHSILTFNQIDDTFLYGKQLTVPIVIDFVPAPSFAIVISEEDGSEEYIERDIHRPPLIFISQHSFRGPPIFS